MKVYALQTIFHGEAKRGKDGKILLGADNRPEEIIQKTYNPGDILDLDVAEAKEMIKNGVVRREALEPGEIDPLADVLQVETSHAAADVNPPVSETDEEKAARLDSEKNAKAAEKK